MAAFDDPEFLAKTVEGLKNLLDNHSKQAKDFFGMAIDKPPKKMGIHPGPPEMPFRTAIGLLNNLFGSDDNKIASIRDDETGELLGFCKYNPPTLTG